ncbi:MAG: hypothetical protein ABIJ25_05520 [Pseudomonadota bacterium]|nr:hypothetical protein [Pseudomonadota bacterium]
MIKKFLFFQIWIIIILFANAALCADKISGSACYTYGDNESLVQAEQMTKTLAIRNAIESYSTFIESTTKITDFQLSSDLINTISTGQVKGVKVLKRLESGRKICYTVEGFIEPNELKSVIKDYLAGKDKSSDVQLQDNGYIRIIGQPTPERLCVRRISSDPKAEIERERFREYDDEESNTSLWRKYGWKKEECDQPLGLRQLRVNLQFLRPCVAKTDPENIEDNLFGWGSMLPRFRCDYRFKVFATFYSVEGSELKTEGQYPIAYWIDKSKDAKRKTEMLPGEKTSLTFMTPYEAKSWKVWVPK